METKKNPAKIGELPINLPQGFEKEEDGQLIVFIINYTTGKIIKAYIHSDGCLFGLKIGVASKHKLKRPLCCVHKGLF